MKISVSVTVNAGDDTPAVIHEAVSLERDALDADTVGLRLDEAKDLLAAVKRPWRPSRSRRRWPPRSRAPAAARRDGTRTAAGTLPERATPELVHLEAKFAGLASYGLSAKLLAEVLPLGRPPARDCRTPPHPGCGPAPRG